MFDNLIKWYAYPFEATNQKYPQKLLLLMSPEFSTGLLINIYFGYKFISIK